MDISINRALSELKLLNKKITDKTAKLQVAVGIQQKTVIDKDVFLKSVAANIQQLRDFIQNRNKIKSAIVLSNAKTKVTIGDKTMTVAEAIERKTSIDLDKALNKKMREDYYNLESQIEQHNVNAKTQADKQCEAALGAQTEGDKGAQYKTIFEAYYEANKAEVLAPEDIKAQIEKDQDTIDEFESEVDFILSESNTKTSINV